MAAKRQRFTFPRRRSTSPTTITRDCGKLLHEGWAVKESGTALFGRTNWRKRWFRLVQHTDFTTLEYYRSRTDRLPAGYVKLNVSYCTRQLEIGEKPYPFCFGVGPLIDDGATRTYYISCVDRQRMQEWMTAIDAVIQGVPDQVFRRKETVNKFFTKKYKGKLRKAKSCPDADESGISGQLEPIVSPSPDPEASPDGLLDATFEEECSASVSLSQSLTPEDLSDEEIMAEMDEEEDEEDDEESYHRPHKKGASNPSSSAGAVTTGVDHRSRPSPDAHLSPKQRLVCYNDPNWRIERWQDLCNKLKTVVWSKIDSKDGITVARKKFGPNNRGYAVIKVEGKLPAAPRNVFRFLQQNMKEGGKLDYLFRNENVVQDIDDEPKSCISYNEFQPPLPRVSCRDFLTMRVWVPQGFSKDGSSGFVMFSVEHPDVPPPEKGYTRVSVDTSGIVLTPHLVEGKQVHTMMTVLIQVAFYGAMHKMLKGAYNSGLLKVGLRTTFSIVTEQLDKYIQVTSI